ncbi:ATP-binding protein [Amycolatopsis sp. NPDC051102]|uniref:ATP-binding protein n=1 Tax=Amycolatopsis sp. NPDC051102 TaxID=3155163 RepID=UPI0034135CD3
MESTESGDPAAAEHVTITNTAENVRGRFVQVGHLYQVTVPDEPMLERLLDAIDERRRATGIVRRKSLPSSLPWTQRAACLGRDRELAELREQLAAGRHVLVGGPAGIGKTLFLLYAGGEAVLSAGTVPGCEGVLRRVLAPGTTPDDVLHDLALECYDAEPAAARRLLGRVRALVVLDGVEWPAGELRQLLDAMPGSVFVIASRRTDYAPVIKTLPLAGLTLADGLELWENELGTPLSAAEKRRAWRIHDTFDGNPGRLAQFAAALRTAGVQGIAPDVADPDAYAMIVDRALAKLGEPAVTTLKELLVFPDASWGRDLLAAGGLRKLEEAGLVEHDSGRYRVRPHVPEAVAPAEPWPLFARITAWAGEQAGAGQIAAELGVLERTLRRLLAHDRPWDALVLARIVSVKLLPTPWWSRGDEVLGLGLRAARRARSRTDIAYFTYALATRRADTERVAEAAELLTALIDSAREHGDRRLADRAGAQRDGLLARAPGALGRGAESVSQLMLRVPFLDTAAFRLAQEHPGVLRKAVAAILLLAGGLFGLPASAGPAVRAGSAPSSLSALAAPKIPPQTSAPPAAGASPSAAASPPPAPPPAVSSPDPAARPSRPPGSGPGDPLGGSADGATVPDHPATAATAAPDLTGKWQIIFSKKRVYGNPWSDPDTGTITLHRLDQSRCAGSEPCYGGQWTINGLPGSSNFVAVAAPGPTRLSATDSDSDGNQSYHGELVSADPQLRYEGEWSDDHGLAADFVFTRLS